MTGNDSRGENRDIIRAFIGGFVTGVECQAWMSRRGETVCKLDARHACGLMVQGLLVYPGCLEPK